MQISLGSQVSQPIFVPYYSGQDVVGPWAKQTVNFTYTDATSSAWLTIKQFFSGRNMNCFPCYDPLLITGVTL